jgi:hypothetical protein
MPEELLFTVHGSTATPAQQLTLAEAGLKERQDLQEWVISHPEILGSEIMIVTMEFDQWMSANAVNADRLDILGLHSSGELVVAELKRDKAPDTVEMQAVKYAAMASRFTAETLAEQHARYLTARGDTIDDDAAADLLARHADITPESLRRPRIVLLASDYPPTTSATAVWLSEMGIDITLMQYRAYRTGEEISVSVSQLYPVPTVEDFTISPRQAEVRASCGRRPAWNGRFVGASGGSIQRARTSSRSPRTPATGTRTHSGPRSRTTFRRLSPSACSRWSTESLPTRTAAASTGEGVSTRPPTSASRSPARPTTMGR